MTFKMKGVCNATVICPRGAHLAVEHLISCYNVQLHTVKVIPNRRK